MDLALQGTILPETDGPLQRAQENPDPMKRPRWADRDRA